MTSAISNFFNNNSSSILGAFGGIGSFIGNQIGSALSSQRSWSKTKAQMYLQDYLNRQYTKDSYSLMREGLSKAGYNPLLALGSSPNQALYSGSAPATDSDAGDQAVNSAISLKQFYLNKKLNDSQIKLNDSQQDLNAQQTYKTFADELKARADAGVSSATEAQIVNNIRWDNLINDARLKEIMANVKFTNERARGFSASSSQSSQSSGGANFGNKKLFSIGANGSHSRSSSSSRSW